MQDTDPVVSLYVPIKQELQAICPVRSYIKHKGNKHCHELFYVMAMYPTLWFTVRDFCALIESYIDLHMNPGMID